ncbi:MAG TPA: GMC family oxidoreductase, partial [Mycobacterium sp.]
ASPNDVADVVIIGAGPSGATYAKYLSSWGFHVVCLEQGRWYSNTEYLGAKDEYEMSLYGKWSKDANLRQAWEDYPTELSESDMIPVMYNAVGGGTIHFGGHWARMLPSDFRVRTLDGVADDWPISYDDLTPFYDETDIEWAAAGLDGDPAYPPGAAPFPQPAFPIHAVGRKVAEGMNKLGWSWWPGVNSIARKPVGDLVPCVRYGTCEAGCPNGSKASADVVQWPAALKNGATLVTGARVSEILTDERGLASGVVFLDRNGTERRLRAEQVILAANGIGTPRLLLMSQSKLHPNGLANSSDMVGRNLMLHPHSMVVGVFEEEFNTWLGPVGQNVQSYEFYETDKSRGHVRGAKWTSLCIGGPMAMGTMIPRGPVGAHGEDLLRDIKRMMGHAIMMVVVSEDLPNPENRVLLDPRLKDPSGLPAPKVIYKIDQNSKDLLAFHRARQREVLEAAGAYEIHEHELLNDEPGHLLGTARMGDDPETSVVNSFGQAHDVPNLRIADGSVFVTSAGVNPTSTIVALALRGAQEMVRQASEMEVPL